MLWLYFLLLISSLSYTCEKNMPSAGSMCRALCPLSQFVVPVVQIIHVFICFNLFVISITQRTCGRNFPFLKKFLLKYSSFTVWCQLLVYKNMIQLCIYIHSSFARFFSQIVYHKKIPIKMFDFSSFLYIYQYALTSKSFISLPQHFVCGPTLRENWHCPQRELSCLVSVIWEAEPPPVTQISTHSQSSQEPDEMKRYRVFLGWVGGRVLWGL